MQQYFVWIETRTDGLSVEAHSPIHAATKYLETKDTMTPMKYSFAYAGEDVPVKVEAHNGEICTITIRPHLRATYEWHGKFVRTFENGFKLESELTEHQEKGDSHE